MFKLIESFVCDVLKKEDKVIIGLSGGPDSVFLLLFLKEYLNADNIIAIHINHMLRENAEKDELYCEKICFKYGIKFFCERFDIATLSLEYKKGIEEVARDIRYKTFNKYLEKYDFDKIVVAHHKNDLAETMMLNLARGTGINGLCSLKKVNGNIVRPLLCLKKQEIEEYLNKNNISYCLDETNFQDVYNRNIVRNKVLTSLEEVNIKAIDNLVNLSNLMLEYSDYIEEKVNEFLDKNLIIEEDVIRFNLKYFYEKKIIEKKHIIKGIFEKLNISKNLTGINIKDIINLTFLQSGKKMVIFSYEIVKNHDELIFKKQNCDEECSVNIVLSQILEEKNVYLLKTNEKNINIFIKKSLGNQKNNYTKSYDYDKIKGELIIRTRKSGDYVVINRKGDKKKLKKFFIDEKIPQFKRDKMMLLTCGNLVLAILEYKYFDVFEVDNKTKNILSIQELEREK